MDFFELSPLGHTWIFDLDGTVLKHNGYIIDGDDSFLPGMDSFLRSISVHDMIIFLTSRSSSCAADTEAFLLKHGIRYEYIIYDVPFGERVLINDRKPSGLKTAIAINTLRDMGCQYNYHINSSL